MTTRPIGNRFTMIDNGWYGWRQTNTNTKATATSWPSAETIPRHFFRVLVLILFSFPLLFSYLLVGLWLLGHRTTIRFDRYSSSSSSKQQIKTNWFGIDAIAASNRSNESKERIGTKALSETKPRNSVEIEIEIETNAASESCEASRRIGTNTASETKAFRLIRGYDTIHVQ